MNHQPNTPASLNEAVADDGASFLIQICGEDIDHPLTAILPDWEAVRRFCIEHYVGSEDHTTHWGERTLDILKREFDEHDADERPGPYTEQWEIGGLSIERVCDCTPLAAPGAAIDAREQESPELLLGWKRYEKARKLSPFQWNRLHIRNLAGENFDAMIDSLPEPTTPVPTPSEALSPATVAQPVADLQVTACYFPSTGDAELSWERVDGSKQFFMTVKVTPEQGNQLAEVVYPCIFWKAIAAQPCASQGCRGAVQEAVANVVYCWNRFRWSKETSDAVSALAALSTAPRSLDGATPGGGECSDERPCLPCYLDQGPCNKMKK